MQNSSDESSSAGQAAKERQQARNLALILRNLRENAGLSRADIAQRTKLQEGYISRLERGFYHRPAVAVMERLAGALSLPVEKLYQLAGLAYNPPTRSEQDPSLPELAHYLTQVQDLPYDDRAIIEKVLRGIFAQEIEPDSAGTETKDEQ